MLSDPTTVILWSDTLMYGAVDRRVVDFAPKQRVNEGARWALMASGPRPIYETLDELTCGSLDQARQRLPEALREIVAAAGRMKAFRSCPHAGFYFGGWSDHLGRFATFAVRSADESLGPGTRAYKPIECNFFTAPRVFVSGEEISFDLETVNRAIASLGALEFCRRVIQNQRSGLGRAAAENSDGRPAMVGGHCDCTIVAAEGVRTVTLIEWPDRTGDVQADLRETHSLPFD